MRGAQVAHHERPQGRVLRLGVVGVHAVVAHLGVGEHHDLPRIGGIGGDFQIAFQRGVEADLPKRLAGRAAGGAGEHRAVLQHEQRRSAPRQRPQKKRSRLGRDRLQAHKMKFAHRTLPVSRYRPLKVEIEHKAPC